MLRVLQVVTHMNRGGLETMLMNYYRHVDRTQVQFDFLTHRPYDGDYGEEIHRLDGKIFHLPTLNPFSRSYLQALNSFFASHPEYSVVHVHQDCMSSVVLRAAEQNGVKVRISHSHTANQEKNLKYPIKLYFKRRIPRYATDLLACGKDAGDWMFGGAPYSVLTNSIDAGAFSFDKQIRDAVRSELGLSPDELVLGHVSNFTPAKNIGFLLEIAASVMKKQSASLLLIGGSDLVEPFVHKASLLGIRDQVLFTGVRSDVNRLLQAVDVFAMPSLYEGVPLALIEAQAAGLPCLISEHVPLDCKKTELVRQIRLSDGPDLWSDAALEAAKMPREDTYEAIKQAGFDVVSNAKWLQDFYLEAAQRT